MDTERTMQFILHNVAALTVSQQKTDEQIRELQTRTRGLQTLVKAGMRLIIKVGHGQQNLDAKLNALVDAQIRTEASLLELAEAQKRLADAQKRTDQRFDRWLNSMK